MAQKLYVLFWHFFAPPRAVLRAPFTTLTSLVARLPWSLVRDASSLVSARCTLIARVHHRRVTGHCSAHRTHFVYRVSARECTSHPGLTGPSAGPTVS
jgi:hypothetical protein